MGEQVQAAKPCIAISVLAISTLLLGGCQSTLSPLNDEAVMASSAILESHRVDTHVSYPQAHSSSLVELPNGDLLATWFAGLHERHPDVKIYTARFTEGQWQPAEVVADGVQPDGSALPTWNPVLFRAPNNVLWLFYKVGPNPREWWGEVKQSSDEGVSWSAAQRLPAGILGPIKNKPIITEMGAWLSPSSREQGDDWTLVFELSMDQGKTWQATSPVASPAGIDAIQPSVLSHSDGRLQAVARTRQGALASAWSSDRGRTWSPVHALNLPNPNSGTDALTLADGRHLVVYNPTAHQPDTPGKGVRYPLVLAQSRDGLDWQQIAVLEDEPIQSGYAYPAMIQTHDGLLHITYTLGREQIKHMVVDPKKLPQ